MPRNPGNCRAAAVVAKISAKADPNWMLGKLESLRNVRSIPCDPSVVTSAPRARDLSLSGEFRS